MKNVFISYSDKDRNKMRTLERLIKKSKILKPIIIADNRQALKLLSEKVKIGIIECDYFIPILTKSSISTQWLNQEIGFATALKKSSWPIVDAKIAGKLRGFIHKQLDLSYSFQGNLKNKRSEAYQFAATSRTLVNDLRIENNESPKDLTIEDLFQGKWESRFIINGRSYIEKEIEIKDNKFFVNNKHEFNIADVHLDPKKDTLKFKKVGVGKDNYQISARLNIIELGKKYQGFEDNIENGNNIPITYNKIS